MQTIFRLSVITGLAVSFLLGQETTVNPFVKFSESCNPISPKSNSLPAACPRVSDCGQRTIFMPRSQGTDTARWISGWKEYLPGCDNKAWGNLSLTTMYTHSTKGERLAQYLFGSTQLRFSGSQVADRNPNDLLADYFGLPTHFEGAIAFEPTIDNVILDTNFQLGLDCWWYGMYMQVHAPLVITRWDLGIHCNEENNISDQEIPVFPPCYMAEKQVLAAQSIRQALSGDFIFGDMKQPLNFGKFPCGKERKVAFADIDLIIGWNFLLQENAHAGVYFITVAPTGNRPHSEFVFEPIVGNGNLWEVGAGFSGHFDFYRCGVDTFSIYLLGHLTHQFKRLEIRSFDLLNRDPLSRYILLKEFDAKNNYKGQLINAIDFSTRCVRVGGSAKLDASIKASFYHDRWGCDLGYNIYARTKETLKLQDNLYPSDVNNRSFGIKGTQGVCYRVFDKAANKVTDKTGILNSTEHRATSTHGSSVDNPQAIELPAPEVAITWNSPLDKDTLKIASNSNPPVIISRDSLDLVSGLVPHQMSHKFFAYVGYTALDAPWEPQLGLGAEIEFDGRSALLSSLNQWGIWFKGSVAF